MDRLGGEQPSSLQFPAYSQLWATRKEHHDVSGHHHTGQVWHDRAAEDYLLAPPRALLDGGGTNGGRRACTSLTTRGLQLVDAVAESLPFLVGDHDLSPWDCCGVSNPSTRMDDSGAGEKAYPPLGEGIVDRSAMGSRLRHKCVILSQYAADS